MMNRPPVMELADKAGSRYMLVTAVSNRARQLQDDPDKLEGRKAVSVAVEEVYADKLIITPRES